jgi:hypothetical protein
MHHPLRTNRILRRGSATIELAILLPLLLTIALICVDFGRFVHGYIAVTNAAREGAYYGSLHPVTTGTRAAWDAAIRQVARDEMTSNSWFDPADMIVPAPQLIDEGSAFRRVEVEVQYPFQTVINWPLLPGYNDPITLSRKVVMRGIR